MAKKKSRRRKTTSEFGRVAKPSDARQELCRTANMRNTRRSGNMVPPQKKASLSQIGFRGIAIRIALGFGSQVAIRIAFERGDSDRCRAWRFGSLSDAAIWIAFGRGDMDRFRT